MNEKQRHLTHIAKKHSHFFTTANEWNKYAKKNFLPSSTTFVYAFGSWNEAKKKIGLPLTKRPKKYTTNQILDIVKKNSKYAKNKEMWNQHAKKHRLPTYLTITQYITWDEVKRLAGYQTDFSKEGLIRLAKEHQKFFVSKRIWDKYAKEKNFPRSITYIRVFGSWKKAQEIVLNSEKE